ncbi:MAG: 16S rRNA (cytidine(1402)-2'-O)-methyltransferase [Vicinamibacterales bacterium]
MPADVLEQIVMRMHPIQRGVGRMRLVQVTEQIVDEVRKGLGSNHRFEASVRAVPDELGPPTQIRQWYNKRSPLMPGTLFVVATPIGNLEDITVRALRVLREVAVIAAEDTRRTSHLLARHAIATPATSLHEHNESAKSASLIARLQRGESIALVSDAGTPTVSDPGGVLIRAAIDAGIRVEPIPGPSAVLAALSAAGLPMSSFAFLGFPPTRSKDRKLWFERLAAVRGTIIFFEAPHRIKATLAELTRIVGDCEAAICRELTKIHETFVRGPISAISMGPFEERGEFTVVVFIGHITDKAPDKVPGPTEMAHEFCVMTKNDKLTRRAAISDLARKHGMSTNQVYGLLEEAKNLVE